MRASMSSGSVPIARRGRRAGRAPARPAGQRPRQDRGVGLRVGAAADADQGLADRRGGGRTCRSRSRSRRAASRAPAAPGCARSRSWSSEVAISSAPRSARHLRDRVGEGRVERVGAVGEGVHRARPQLAPPAGSSSPPGRRSPGPGGPSSATRASAPAGRRWMPVISAPDSVVGIAATRAPVTAATALATSIGRPPPRATSDSRPAAARAGSRRGRGPGRAGPRARPPPRPPSSAARGQRRAAWSAARTARSRARRAAAAPARPRRGGRRPCGRRRAR